MDMSIDTVLAFWFGALDDQGRCKEDKSALWWGKSAQTDQLIKQKFSALLIEIAAGGRADWLASGEGRLATIIVLDQFSRNIYREQPESFANDALALSHAVKGIEARADMTLYPIQRVFFYLPLEHSESLAMQEQSVYQFRKLLENVEPQDKIAFQGYLDFAQRHYDVVARYGRYPHRNAILGRNSSDAEVGYLNQPGSGF